MPYTQVHGRGLFYIWRDGKEPRQPCTLLFAHGLGGTHAYFEPLIPRLVAAGFSCLAFDYSGSGLSAPAVDNRGIPGIANDAKQLIANLGVPPQEVVAVGHSMGSLVVSELASKEELGGAVLIGPINPSAALGEVFAKRMEVVTKDGMEPMADTIPAAATGSKATPLHRAFIKALLLSQRPEGYNFLCRAIAEAQPPNFSKITAPVLVIAGEDDQTANMEGVRKIVDSFSNVSSKTLQVLPGVGHWHCIEAPDAVAALIEKFARSC